LRQDDIVINEAIRKHPSRAQSDHAHRPQTYFGLSGGGLGFSGGMALGAKLARPGARVVQIVGDGGFHFSTPTSVYAVAQQYGLPVFTIVLDNGGWQAVKEAVLRVYPKGTAAAANAFQAGLEGNHRHFEQIAARVRRLRRSGERTRAGGRRHSPLPGRRRIGSGRRARRARNTFIAEHSE